jgi:hypothetical protein
MSLTLAQAIAAVETAAQVATALKTVTELTYDAAVSIYSYAKDMIVTAEQVYGTETAAGSSKLSAVLAAVGSFATSLGADWSKLEALITSFVNGCISFYNQLIAGVKSVKTAVTETTASSDVTADTTAAVTA